MCEFCGNTNHVGGNLEILIDHDFGSDTEAMLQVADQIEKAIKKPVSQYSREKMLRRIPRAYSELLRKLSRRWDVIWGSALDAVLDELNPSKNIQKSVPSRHGKKGLEEFWFPLNREKIQIIRDIITQHIEAFLYNNYQADPLEWRVSDLVANGLIEAAEDIFDVIHDEYVLGRAVDSIERGADYKHVMDLAANRPLSKYDKFAIEWMRDESCTHIRGLANDAMDSIEKIVRQNSKDEEEVKFILARAAEHVSVERQAELREEAAAARRAGLSWKQFSSQLKHVWGDATRDWDRIAFTEMEYARNWALGNEYLDRYGPDIEVCKIPGPNACKICKYLYTDEETGKPRVFKLMELMNYGSNGNKWMNPATGQFENRWASRIRYDSSSGKFDKNSGGLVPTLGPIHPWCACLLMLWSSWKMIHMTKSFVTKARIQQ